MRTLFRAAGLTAAVVGVLVTTAVPSGAAASRPIQTGIVSITGVDGNVHEGATISVVETCPTGTTIARGITREAGEVHSGGLTVESRELWPAGMVTRYRVGPRAAGYGGLVLTALACKTRVATTSTLVRGRATVDVRVWGPAASRLTLVNAALIVVASNLYSGDAYATTMRAAGVNENHASVRGAVTAVQDELNEDGSGVVFAIGQTHKAVVRGQFASMQNHYRFRGHLDQKLWAQ